MLPVRVEFKRRLPGIIHGESKTGSTVYLEPAEIFHEILEHRWYLSERAGHEVGIFDTARDYIDRFLTAKPDEVITGQE